ncbi:MAG: hypothetical protein ABIJ42_04870 [Acidobacteriota bacterium]
MKNNRRVQSFDKLGPLFLSLSYIFLVLFLGFVDYSTGTEFSFSIFYLLPISLASWYIGKRAGIFISIISSIMWFLADFIGGNIYSSTLILIWNSVMRLSLFLIISILLSNFKIKILKIHQKDLALQKNRTVIETFQRLTIIIAENITTQNAEIIKWVNEKKNKSIIVPDVLEKSSRVIGESLQILSEISFISPYIGEPEIDADTYLELLTKKLAKIKNDLLSNNDGNYTDTKKNL